MSRLVYLILYCTSTTARACLCTPKQNANYLTMSLDVTTCQFEGNGHTVYPSTSYSLAYTATNAQLMAADTSLTSVLSATSFYTLCGSNIRRTKGSASTFGSITANNGLTVSGGTVTLPSGSVAGTAISSLDASKITTGSFSVGVFGSTNISTTGSLTCASSALASGATGTTIISTTYAAGLGSGQYMISPYGVNGSAYNAGFTAFNYTNGAGSSNNYYSFGVWGYLLGSQTFNACANGNFGICTTTPSSTLDVNGTFRASSNFTVSGGTVTLPSGSVAGTAIASLDASKITTGTLGSAQIPSLDASKITTGTFGTGAFGANNIATTGSLTAGTTTTSNSANAQFGLLSGATTNNAQFALAGIAGNYSTDAAVGDAVLRNNSGNLLLQTNGAASAICINSTSNYVGVGTKTPQYQLDVAGVVNTSASSNAASIGGLLASVTNIGTGTARSLGTFALTKTLTGAAGPLDTSNVHNYASLSNIFSGGTIQYYNLNITGFINIPAAATYTFQTVGCDDSIRVNIDGNQVLSAGLNLNGSVVSSNTTFASAGWKNISIIQQNTGGNQQFRLQWAQTTGTTFAITDIPGSNLAYDQTAKPSALGGPCFLDQYNNRLGIGTVSPSSMLHVTSNAQFDGAVTFGSGVAASAGQTVTVPCIVAVNDSTDSGTTSGVRWWQASDSNWATNMVQSGTGKSVAGGAACTSLDGRTAHHIRNRCGNGSQQGFLWENAGENCLMSLAGDTGNLFIGGTIGSSSVRVGGTAYLKGVDCTSMSSSGAVSGTTGSFTNTLTLNSADQDKIILTNISYGSKLTHGVGWIVGYYASPNNEAMGTHSWYTGTASGWVNRMNLINNGNLGIGTSSPSAKLHVLGGSAQFDSNVTITSALSTSNLTATGTVSFPAGSISAASTTGTFTASQIPSLDASKITGGTFSVGNFGSTNITTSGLISGGCLPKYWNASKQGVTQGSGCYALATFDAGYAAGNIGSSVRVCGTIGGYLFNQQATVDLTFIVRNGVTVTGSAIGYVSAAQGNADIVLYQDSTGSASTFTLYINSVGSFVNWDLSVESGQIGVTLKDPATGGITAPGGQILLGLTSANRITELSSGAAVTSLNNTSIYTYSSTLTNNVNWTTTGTANTGPLKCGAITAAGAVSTGGAITTTGTGTYDIGPRRPNLAISSRAISIPPIL
jgi:fibronectin-binding autotransporter adhesin